MNAVALTNAIEVFFGELSPAEARVYARLALGEELAGAALRGTVRGPYSRYAHTLTASVPFRALASDDTLLAQAIVPDPCFWTPEAPYRYEVTVEVLRGGAPLASITRELGLRPLGAAGRQLRLEARNYVVRAARANRAATPDLAMWHAAEMALLLETPDDALCAEASAMGVLIIAELPAAHPHFAHELQRLARQAAVGIVVVTGANAPGQTSVAMEAWRRLSRNIILAPRFSDAAQLTQFAARRADNWAQALIFSAENVDELIELLRAAQGVRVPILVELRNQDGVLPLEGRSGCDRLQRELASQDAASQLAIRPGDIAGYIV